MKALPILILVAVLCGPCACQPTTDKPQTPDNHGLISLLDNAGSSVIHNLSLPEIFERFIALGKNIIQYIEKNASRVSEAPRKIIETFVRLAREFIANTERVLKNIVSYYAAPINDLVTSAQNDVNHIVNTFAGNGSKVSRKLRSILSSPIQELEYVGSSIISEFGNQLISIMLELLKWTWHFLKTIGLPWLHEILNKIAALNGTPVIVRTAIQDLDVAYGLMQLLGFLN